KISPLSLELSLAPDDSNIIAFPRCYLGGGGRQLTDEIDFNTLSVCSCHHPREGAELLFKPLMKTSEMASNRVVRRSGLALRSGMTILLGLALVCGAGCNRDPKKFLAKGNQAFDQGKYPDAILYYGRALQLDPRFAEAHFKLAQTHL